MTEHRRLVALVSTQGKTAEEVAAELVRRLNKADHPTAEVVEEQQPVEQSGRLSE